MFATINIPPRYLLPDGTCEIRVRLSDGTYTTFKVRAGETAQVLDPTGEQALRAIPDIFTPVGSRPARIDHDVDRKVRTLR